MTASRRLSEQQNQRKALALGAAFPILMFALQTQAFPISSITFMDDTAFKGIRYVHSVTSSDGLLTAAGWSDRAATNSADLFQWWWIFGVESTAGNGALLDGDESMTLQFDKAVGASHIAFLYAGNASTPDTPAQISISGFLKDPQAYATVYNSPHISNLAYTNGTLTFDYLYDKGSDYGQLLFADAAASAGATLTITYTGTSWGAGLFRVDSQELFGGPALQPAVLRHDATNAYTTPDGGLTVRGYADANATVPANFGTYVDQCFGVVGGANTGAVDTDESITLQFAPAYGLSRLDSIYSSGLVTISGFGEDPGFTDNLNGSLGSTYLDGVLSFTPADTGHHAYFFSNRAASAGRTLKLTVDPGAGYQFAIAGIGYAKLQTLLGSDIPNEVNTSYTTPDGMLTLNAYSDTPGTSPAYLHENVDWFGISGGINSEALEGTESLDLQFSGGAGLAGLGTRYTSANIVISGFAADPGFTDPSGTATNVTYSNGTLTYNLNSWRSPEIVVTFSNLSASAGRTLSMHTDGDPNAQIALTRVNYALPSAEVTLSVARQGSDIVLTWPSGVLQQSTNVTGTYIDLGSATSPYTNAAAGPQKFFRVKVQ